MLLAATSSERCDCGSLIPAGGAWIALFEDGGDKGASVVAHAHCVACALSSLGVQFQDARLHNPAIKTIESRLDAIEKLSTDATAMRTEAVRLCQYAMDSNLGDNESGNMARWLRDAIARLPVGAKTS